MARLSVSLLTWGAVLLTPLPLLAQQGGRQDLVSAGNCARCHVSSSLEWGLSKHSILTRSKSGRRPNCVGCHGESRDHVIDEQNTAKPDRMAHGNAIAKLCLECHPSGCARSMDLNNCETCHHIHALVNPTLDAATIEKRASDLAALMQAYQGHLAEGERLGQQAQWEPARAAFAAALKDFPASDRARAALAMIARRLKPGIGGFKIVGDQFDAPSGLPREIVMDGSGIDLVLVPAGSLDLGTEQHADTQPVHTVNIAPFYLAKFEMSQAQWKALMSANPSFHQGAKFPQADTMPVEQISWEDCQKMLAEINQKVPGGGFRLPTEAEWEYAARAGSTDPADAAKVLSFAWLRENSRMAGAAADAGAAPPAGAAGGAREASNAGMAQMFKEMQRVEAAKLAAPDSYAPHPVGALRPNGWGLYDLLGNVSEWCSSLYEPFPYDAADGREATVAPGRRVLRGDTYMDSAESADFARRHSDRPNRKLRWNGVRLAFSPPAVEPAAMGSESPSDDKAEISRSQTVP
jgi:formylglycine-generating enzyme required for sulfatase activity